MEPSELLHWKFWDDIEHPCSGRRQGDEKWWQTGSCCHRKTTRPKMETRTRMRKLPDFTERTERQGLISKHIASTLACLKCLYKVNGYALAVQTHRRAEFDRYIGASASRSVHPSLCSYQTWLCRVPTANAYLFTLHRLPACRISASTKSKEILLHRAKYLCEWLLRACLHEWHFLKSNCLWIAFQRMSEQWLSSAECLFFAA